MLTRETRVDGGELAFEKGTRVALHDQRPPLERRLSLRDWTAVKVSRKAGKMRQPRCCHRS